jgi:hypothetical protein
MNIEQLKADMEAGTQGDNWTISVQAGEGDTNLKAVTGPVQTTRRGHKVSYHVAQYVKQEDARRIARVPQLERIALDAEALADALTLIADLSSHDMGMSASDERCVNRTASEALAAYREATK